MKYLIYSLLFTISLINFTYSQIPNKKPAIILYEDGTWEKVEKENTKENSKKMTIEETWEAFKLSLKSGEKEKVAEFFEFPVSNDINTNLSNSNLASLNGSMTKKKLLEKFEFLFDKEITNLILNKDAEEYEKGESKPDNRFYTLKREMEWQSKHSYGVISHKDFFNFVFAFKLVKNKYKIYSIQIDNF